MTMKVIDATHISVADVEKHTGVSIDYLRRKIDPDDTYYNDKLAHALGFNRTLLKRCLSQGIVHRLTEEHTAELLGTNIEVLRRLDALKPQISNWYEITDIEAYLTNNGTFIGGCAPGLVTISDVFDPGCLLYQIVIDQHDNKHGDGAADFSGTLTDYLQKEISPWRNEPEVSGVIGDGCRDVHKAREILLDTRTQAKLLNASVDLRFSNNAEWVTVQLIGVARFYMEMGVPPFFSSLSDPEEI